MKAEHRKSVEEIIAERAGLDPMADLFEEERAAGGQLGATALETIRAGEGPALMSEEFGLRQRFGQGGAVDRHERSLGTSARIVDGTSDQFFPSPAFAGEQEGCILPGDQSRLVQRLAKSGRACHDAVEAVLSRERTAQPLHSAFEPPAVLFGGRQPLVFLGQTLVLERDHDLTGNPYDDLAVCFGVSVGLALAEREHAVNRIAEDQAR
jgi:hypothetical protein